MKNNCGRSFRNLPYLTSNYESNIAYEPEPEAFPLQGLRLGKLVPRSHKRSNLAMHCSAALAEEIRASERTFQSRTICGLRNPRKYSEQIRAMDQVYASDSTEYALQSVKWCIQNNETNTLKAVLDASFKESNLSLFDKECRDILYSSVASDNDTGLDLLLTHVDEGFLKQTFGNDRKTLSTKLLSHAVNSGQAKTIQSLVKRGADSNIFYQGKPMLHWALELGHIEVVKALVEAGASLSILDRRGQGILASASLFPLRNKADIVRWLIDKGADPMQRSSSGKLPIHISATCCPETLGVIIQSGCDVNTRDDIHEETPLHYACNSCCKETILLLIQSGAAFNLVNIKGETALQKLLKFAVDYHDFHSKLRIDTAKQLISIGFKMLLPNSKYQALKRKGRDKIRDLYTSLKASVSEVPKLQSIARTEVRETVSGCCCRKKLEVLNIPKHLKPYLMFSDFSFSK